MLLRADLHPFRPSLIFAYVFNDHAEVCPVSRGVMIQPPVRAIAAWHVLSLRSHPRTVNSPPHCSTVIRPS